MISLSQAKQLVTLLENEQQEEANTVLFSLMANAQEHVFNQVGKITRQLHDSLEGFRLDPRLSDLASTEIPDAKDSLNYVISATESAANRTMDALDSASPIADRWHDSVGVLQPQWMRLMDGQIQLSEFKELCHATNGLLNEMQEDSVKLRTHLTDVLMAQDFQDLTGQIICRVIELVQEVEDQLIQIVKAFGTQYESSVETAPLETDITAEGPIIHSHQRIDVVSSQDDVDDLLSNLGF